MRKPGYLIVLTMMLFFGSCTPIELARVDQGSRLAIQAAEQGGQVLSSPIGLLIPPPITAGLKLAMAGLVAAAMGWQEFRRRTAKQGIAEIVKGVEVIKNDSGDGVKNAMDLTQSQPTKRLVAQARAAL